jgi:hypothetical protein
MLSENLLETDNTSGFLRFRNKQVLLHMYVLINLGYMCVSV